MKRNNLLLLCSICAIFGGIYFGTGLGCATAGVIASVPETKVPVTAPVTTGGIGAIDASLTGFSLRSNLGTFDLSGSVKPGLFSPSVVLQMPAARSSQPMLETAPQVQPSAWIVPTLTQRQPSAVLAQKQILAESVGQLQKTDEAGRKDVIDALYLGRSASVADAVDAASQDGASGPSVPAANSVLKAHGPAAALRRRSVPLRRAVARLAGKTLGIDLTAMDATVRPQDDFFRYVNGTWLKTFQMPADESRFGVFNKLRNDAEDAVKGIIEEAAADAPRKGILAQARALLKRFSGDGAQQRQIADLYKSYMNTELLEQRGLQPVAGDLAKIDAIQDKSDLAAAFAQAGAQGIGSPIGLYVGQDDKNNSAYITQLVQSGLGLPDRDFYFAPDRQEVRQKYLGFLTTLFTLAGESAPQDKAQAVYALEEALAKHHWTKVEMRDAEKSYNKFSIRELFALAKGFDWAGYLRAAGIRQEETEAIVATPSYFTGFAQVLAEQPLESWKLYMKARTLKAAAPYLSKVFVDASFDFYGRALSGQPEMRPRWKRGVGLVNGALGEAVGRIYVKKYFPRSSLKRMKNLVENLRTAYKQRVMGLAWMSEETKKKALEKLQKFLPKIGYPAKWEDYSKLDLRPDDLLGNVRRSNEFDYQRMVGKLGQPVDRGEWGMTPQTVNAYYNPVMNEIVFPAAILQAPFFDPKADDAVNYGAIGAVIGHEMSHGFDDQGAHYDGDGMLKNWWTKEDVAAFQARTAKLVKQYDAFEPLPGKHLNGQLTLGENIGDLGGLTVAYRAYQLSLGDKQAPVMAGFTGDQRFFLGFAQVWRSIYREAALLMQIATDPHSPPEFRVNGVTRNMPEFYKAFGVKPGDKLYLSDDERVSIW